MPPPMGIKPSETVCVVTGPSCRSATTCDHGSSLRSFPLENRKDDVEIDSIVARAKKAANYICILKHSRKCLNTKCPVRGCDAARQLLRHVSVCRETECTPACMQAKTLIRHTATCGKQSSEVKSDLSQMCLVCSFVARSEKQYNSMCVKAIEVSQMKQLEGSVQRMCHPITAMSSSLDKKSFRPRVRFDSIPEEHVLEGEDCEDEKCNIKLTAKIPYIEE